MNRRDGPPGRPRLNVAARPAVAPYHDSSLFVVNIHLTGASVRASLRACF
jgi:hypothetical protein